MTPTIGARLIEAVRVRDEEAIASCFTADARFRALVPSGVRERAGAEEAASLIAGWFADSTEFDLVDPRSATVGDRLYIAYLIHGVEEGQPYVVEQHLYCTIADDRIEGADLLCSGFRPRVAR